MGKNSETYTVMILPSPTSEPYRFSVTKKTLYCTIGGASFLGLLLVAFLIQYFVLVGQVWEMNLLRNETKSQKVQIQGFLSTVSDLKKQLLHLRELETKLRVITDTPVKEDSKPGKENKEASAELMGMGGPDEAPDLASDASLRTAPETQISNTRDLLRSIQEDLGNLTEVATREEAAFQQISSVMQGKRAIWASTPSIWPVSGWLTSGFGNRISPFTGEVSMHKGIDIAARPLTPVVAPANGIVVRTGFDGGFGNMIRIDHGFGMMTAYGHLAKIGVHVGQRVSRGQLIGFVGSTGLSTGPHLHYEVYVNSSPVNPLRYILN